MAKVHQLDMVFMIGSCCSKVERLNYEFPKLINALKDPVTGEYPDLRIALIDGNLGTGGAYPDGTGCGRNSSNGWSYYGDLGRFQMRDAVTCGMKDPSALWIEYSDGQPSNYNGNSDAISNVFSCLSSKLSTSGCGIEQQLQAFEFALLVGGIGNDEQRKMLRPYAQLALIFLTDKEDCSASPNNGMFGDKPELAGESALLRCVTRGHACDGVDLTTAPPGYPTTAEFSTPFANCRARTDTCPNVTDGDPEGTDTSVPTACSPLKSIKAIADHLKALKHMPEQKLLVAGIFGWPRAEEMATATYRIGLVPWGPAQRFDYWPVCYHPDFLPKDNAYDAAAWGPAAQGGLRLAAFVDEFGSSGLKFSICERDYADAMSTIGTTLARRMKNACLSGDVGKYASCTARLQLPDGAGGYLPSSTSMPSCDSAPVSTPCYKLAPDDIACAAGEYLVEVVPSSAVAPGTVLQLDCK